MVTVFPIPTKLSRAPVPDSEKSPDTDSALPVSVGVPWRSWKKVVTAVMLPTPLTLSRLIAVVSSRGCASATFPLLAPEQPPWLPPLRK